MLNPAELRTQFASPDAEYRPVPWWLWTGRMTEPEMARQLDLLREQGIYEFFIFCIYGMETEYMSEEFMGQVAFTMDYCAQHGMKAWIYDEYTWPSGVCAGFVMRDHPWTKARSLRWKVVKTTGEAVEIPYEGDFLAARAVAPDGAVTELPAPAAGEPLKYAGPAADVVVLWTHIGHIAWPYASGAEWLPNEETYLDTLDRAAVGKFIEYTHDRYFARFSPYFGNVMPGFFTDEPCTLEPLPFTADLFDDFARRYGYDLPPRLHELLLETGDYRRTRFHFWKLTSERFADAYHKQIREWCDAHGVIYTGHVGGEETLWEILRWNGDLWEGLRWMSAPGIDMLANMTGYGTTQRGTIFYEGTQQRLFHHAVKIVAGICRHVGAKRMLSEAFGVSTLGLTAADMRWGANWQAALGVNLFNDNTLQYTIAGFRKWATSGKHFTTPWFQRYQLFSDYCSRLCRTHAEGAHTAEIALLYPRTTTFCLANGDILNTGGRQSSAWQSLQDATAAVTEALVQWQWDFDFVFEQLVEEARVEGGALDSARTCHVAQPPSAVIGRESSRPGPTVAESAAPAFPPALVIGDARYRVVILPETVALPGAVARKLDEFARSGGTIIAVGGRPAHCPDDGSTPTISALRALVNDTEVGARLDAELAAAVARPLRVTGDKARLIVSSQRRHADGDIFFVANMDQEEVAHLEVELAGGPACEIWDLDNGGTFDARAAATDGGCRLALSLEPRQGVFLRPCDRVSAPVWAPAVLAEQALGEEWRFDVSPGNMLRLAVEARFDPTDQGATQAWYNPVTPGEWLAAKDSLLPEDLTPEKAATYWVRGRFTATASLSGLRLVVDDSNVIAAWLDGQPLPAPAPANLWDQENLSFDLPDIAPGEHTIVVHARTSIYHSPRLRGPMGWPLNALDPFVIVGDFAVESSETPQVIGPRATTLRVGDWTPHGYHYFAGVGEYRQTVQIPDRPGRVLIDFGQCRDILEVEVNGQVVGARMARPYRFEATDALRPGDNEVTVRVFGTLGNLMWEHYALLPRAPVVAGLLGPCRLVWTE